MDYMMELRWRKMFIEIALGELSPHDVELRMTMAELNRLIELSHKKPRKRPNKKKKTYDNLSSFLKSPVQTIGE